MLLLSEYPVSEKQKVGYQMSKLKAKFDDIRYGKRSLSSYGYVRFSKKQALDSINEDFIKLKNRFNTL